MRALLFLLAMVATPAWAQQTNALHSAVEAYGTYQHDISVLATAPIEAQAQLDDALALASDHDPGAVSRGWIAYGALTAAQSPAFVAGVRGRVRAAGRAPVIRQLARDITYARRRPGGAPEAIRLIVTAARGDGARISATATRYSEIARAIETAAWVVPAEDARAARDQRLRTHRARDLPFAPRLQAQVLSATPLTDVRAFGGAAFWDALAERNPRPSPLPAASERAARADTLNRMLTLAGLFIVGAVDEQPARVSAMLEDAPSRECLIMEQLQLRQCVSVTHYAYEGAHCLARHGLAAPSACFSAIAQ